MNHNLKEDNKNLIGVYMILNTINNKYYVGSTKTKFITRFNHHKNLLISNKHGNKYLQRSFNKNGKENFIFKILEICSIEEIIAKEQYYIDFYKAYDRDLGYNILSKAFSSEGYKHTKENLLLIGKLSKLKGDGKGNLNSLNSMWKATKGLKRTEEHKKAISKAHKGKKHSEETRKKISVANFGKSLSNKRQILLCNYNYDILFTFKDDISCSKFLKIAASTVRYKAFRQKREKEYIIMYEYYPIINNKTKLKNEDIYS